MKYRYAVRMAALLGAAIIVASSARSPAFAQEPRAVIELFTSQNCSSCPPADRLMGELSHDPSLVVLSLPVDYWDYLGWKDTLALHGHTNRQRAYSRARGDRDVYTPQVVVNGIAQVLGSDKAAIERAIGETQRTSSPLTVPVTMTVADGKVTVKVAAAPDQTGDAEIWLCPVTASKSVAIGHGENSGHTLTYHDVVRRWIKLGVWNGKAETFTQALSDLPNANYTLQDIDSLAVVVQSGAADKPGLMLGAATASLK
jgi:hypothetical protein